MSELGRASRVLVVLMGSIGDVTRGLGMARPLRRAVPDGQLGWLVEPTSAPLVRLVPEIDSVIVFDRPRGFGAVPQVWRELRDFKPDVTLDLQRHFKSGFFTRLSGAPRRIGFHPANSKEGNWIFQTETIARADDTLSKLDHYGLFLERLRCPGSIDSTPLDRVVAVAPLERPYVAVVLGSAWVSKDWFPAGYHGLLELIVRRGRHGVVLLGDAKRRALGDELVAAYPGEPIVNLAGSTTLPEVAAIMRGARAGVGPDSGPGHIAAAVGTRYVGIFGPTSPARTAPRGSELLAVSAPVGCAPCYRRRCPGLDTVCLRLVSPAAVWERLAPLLGVQ